MICNHCGGQIEDDSVFCGFCGGQQPQSVFCPDCGNKQTAEKKFCVKCGASLSSAQKEEEELTVPEKETDSETAKSSPTPSLRLILIGFAILIFLVGGAVFFFDIETPMIDKVFTFINGKTSGITEGLNGTEQSQNLRVPENSVISENSVIHEDSTIEEVLEIGAGYLLEANYEQALTIFTKAAEVDPKNEKAWLGLANAHIGLGDSESAKGSLESAIQQLPDSATLRTMLIELDYESENLEEATLLSYSSATIPNGIYQVLDDNLHIITDDRQEVLYNEVEGLAGIKADGIYLINKDLEIVFVSHSGEKIKAIIDGASIQSAIYYEPTETIYYMTNSEPFEIYKYDLQSNSATMIWKDDGNMSKMAAGTAKDNAVYGTMEVSCNGKVAAVLKYPYTFRYWGRYLEIDNERIIADSSDDRQVITVADSSSITFDEVNNTAKWIYEKEYPSARLFIETERNNGDIDWGDNAYLVNPKGGDDTLYYDDGTMRRICYSNWITSRVCFENKVFYIANQSDTSTDMVLGIYNLDDDSKTRKPLNGMMAIYATEKSLFATREIGPDDNVYLRVDQLDSDGEIVGTALELEMGERSVFDGGVPYRAQQIGNYVEINTWSFSNDIMINKYHYVNMNTGEVIHIG